MIMQCSDCYASPATWCYRCWCPQNDDAWTDLPQNLHEETQVSNDRYVDNLGKQTNKVDTVLCAKVQTFIVQFMACFGTGGGVLYGTFPSVPGLIIGGSCLLFGGERCVQACCCCNRCNRKVKQVKADDQETHPITRRMHYCATGSGGSKNVLGVYN